MESTTHPQFTLAGWSPAARMGLFVAAMLLMIAMAAPVGFVLSGRDGIACVVVAGGVCLLSGFAALMVHELFRAPQWILLDVLAGFLLRMGAPLVLFMVVHYRGGPLADAGFALYVLAFYFGSLLAGLALSLPRSPSPPGGS